MMKASKHFEIVQTNVPAVFAIVNKNTGDVLIQYKISPYAGTMQNMQYSTQLTEVLEDYCRAVSKVTG